MTVSQHCGSLSIPDLYSEKHRTAIQKDAPRAAGTRNSSIVSIGRFGRQPVLALEVRQ
jgi:hypothetical protein